MNIDDMEVLDEETRKEVKVLQKVTRERDGDEEYAFEQLRKGNLLYENSKTKEALIAWHSINKNDIREVFVAAQWNISINLMENDDIEKALPIWRSIKKSDGSEFYAQAQWNIGLSFDNAGNIGEAMRIWSYIEKTEDSSAYAAAQLNIGLILFGIGYVEAAIKIWSGIERSYNSEKYVKAKWMSGLALVTLNENKEALSEWHEIKATDGHDIYAQAQYKIGEILTNDSNLKNYTEAELAFNNAEKHFPYEVYCYKKVCNLLLKLDSESIGEKILLLLVNTLKIVEILKLDFNQDSKDEKPPERKLAHYTSTEVANILLNEEDKKKQAGYLRLNTISNMNDPSEGLLLRSFLEENKALTYNVSEFDERSHAFFSCFTFNHDSLNQFRLYGKKNFQEASGVSFVFNKEFFQSDNLLGGLTYLFFHEKTDKIYDDGSKVKQINKDLKSMESSKNKKRINKQSVMRCVYIDPASDYIQLAQRNRLTFHREFKISEHPEKKWQEYKKSIDTLTTTVAELLNILKEDYQYIRDEYKEFFKENSELIDKILLPLKYLIKHSAFQEEQECRMIYITSLSDEKVQMVYGDFLYVEYESNVKNYLNKVYIAPAATQYQPYLAKLLCNTNVKIELSNNPYRQI